VGTWTASAYIEGTSVVNNRLSANFVVPSAAGDCHGLSIRLFHSTPGGASGGPYSGTVVATNIMVERGLVATTYKKAVVSANNKITSAKTSTYISSLSADVITAGSLSAKRIDSGADNVGTGLTFALGTALALPKVGLGGAGDGSITAAGSFKSSGTGVPFTLVAINENSTEGYGLISIRKNSSGAAIASWGNWNGLVSTSRTISSSAVINANAVGAIFSAFNNTGGTEATNYITSKATLASGATASTAIGLELLNYDAVGALASTSKYGVGISSVWYAVNSDAVIKTTNTTASTSSATGALLVSGGAGIGGNLNVGGNLAVTGTFTPNSMSLSSTTESSSETTGALVVSGGIGLAKSLTFGTAAAAKSSGGFRHTADEFGALRLVTKRPSSTSDRFITRAHVVQTDPASMILEHAKYDGSGNLTATDTVYLNLYYSKFYSLYSVNGVIGLIGPNNTTTMIEVTGSITATGTITPFTGSHDGFTGDTPEVGDIVVDDICLLHKDVYNTVFKVDISSSTNQKAAVGVCASISEEYPDRFLANGEFSIEPTVLEGLSYIIFNSVGEGQINVCGENGDIEKGDLIVTSSTPGKGMKQDDDLVRSYTVAKAREAVTFTSPSEVKMIACIYMCG
jgi:hypothetical protein